MVRGWYVAAGAGVLALALLGGCSAGRESDAAGTDSASPGAEAEPFLIVVIGDSIPFNSPGDCPGCTGFAQGFADALETERGEPVELRNRSRHDGATTQDIEAELARGSLSDAVSAADIVLVSIGFNNQPPYSDPAIPCAVASIPTDADAMAALEQTSTQCIDAATSLSRASAATVLGEVRSLAPDAAVGVLTSYNSWIGWDVVLATSPERIAAVSDVTTYALDQWNDALCAEAAKIAAVCVDSYGAFNGADGRQSAGDLLAGDFTHPSQLGNDKIRDLLLASDLAG